MSALEILVEHRGRMCVDNPSDSEAWVVLESWESERGGALRSELARFYTSAEDAERYAANVRKREARSC